METLMEFGSRKGDQPGGGFSFTSFCEHSAKNVSTTLPISSFNPCQRLAVSTTVDISYLSGERSCSPWPLCASRTIPTNILNLSPDAAKVYKGGAKERLYYLSPLIRPVGIPSIT
ncbi:hypothetical protein PM082_007047 [Marasmius tenuissimus]|nr:hypothetical protein PM082_007047 [Marasmius tenuissimus]